jgi:enoyl-CoA hydratase
MKMILTGEFIDAATAFTAGLVAEVVPTGEALRRGLELASLVAANAPRQVEMAKAAVRAAEDVPLAAGLHLERQALYLAFTTRDREEGMRAFVEKRPPRFSGE